MKLDDSRLIISGPHTFENWRRAPVIQNRGSYFTQVRFNIRRMAEEQQARDRARAGV